MGSRELLASASCTDRTRAHGFGDGFVCCEYGCSGARSADPRGAHRIGSPLSPDSGGESVALCGCVLMRPSSRTLQARA